MWELVSAYHPYPVLSGNSRLGLSGTSPYLECWSTGAPDPILEPLAAEGLRVLPLELMDRPQVEDYLCVPQCLWDSARLVCARLSPVCLSLCVCLSCRACLDGAVCVCPCVSICMWGGGGVSASGRCVAKHPQ